MFTLPPIPVPDDRCREAAALRQAQLTKPAGALGRLETLSLHLAAAQARERPRVERASVLVFAGDHGVARQGVSAYPQEVTAQMCLNFCRGGAAVNVLARQAGAEVEVIDVGVIGDLPPHPRLVSAKVAPGTADFTQQPAMGGRQCAQAMEAGAQAIRRAAAHGAHAVVLGEMGIANSTSAAALMAAYLGLPPEDCCGRGTGLDDAGVTRKCAVVARGLALHREELSDPLGALAALGGFELAALAGAALQAAALRLPVVVDGFIVSAAMLAAINLDPAVRPFLFWGHRSAEQAHRLLLDAVDADPLLDLHLRLGEGTGGVLALHLLRAACRTLEEMATFGDAGVATAAPRAATGAT
jgi:nicotinate-nucleotide--dimethylbenzimidazole phosphoribosyltransferase